MTGGVFLFCHSLGKKMRFFDRGGGCDTNDTIWEREYLGKKRGKREGVSDFGRGPKNFIFLGGEPASGFV